MNALGKLVVCAAGLAVVACSNDANDSVTAPRFAKTAGPTDPTSTWYIPLDATLGFQSDGKYVNAGSSVYAQGVCGVDSKIFATTEASNSGDAILQTDNPMYATRKCPDYPRKVTIAYPDGVSESGSFFGNLNQIENTTYSMAIGNTVARALNLRAGSRCGTLRLRAESVDHTNYFGADSVLVTRVDSRTWDVASQADEVDATTGATIHHDKAYCDNTGELVHMPVRFRIVASRDLP